MLIEHAPSNAVRSFRVDALSSAVGLKVEFDMSLRVLAQRMRGYADARARQVCRDRIDIPATVTTSGKEIEASFHWCSNLPILLASGLTDQPVADLSWDGYSERLTTCSGPANTSRVQLNSAPWTSRLIGGGIPDGGETWDAPVLTVSRTPHSLRVGYG